MKQRVALARAWVMKPKILLMDEPFGALDAQTRILMQETLTQLWQDNKTTVLFVTHDIDESLAGFCWTKVHTDTDPVLGEIYVVAIDPKYRGQGLGKSMVVSGLINMSDRGISTAMLYVDTNNEAAMSLYGDLGFRIHRTDRAFVGDVGTNLDNVRQMGSLDERNASPPQDVPPPVAPPYPPVCV
jgi:ribosomal protein S18 acetylase RimI-like enzyme